MYVDQPSSLNYLKCRILNSHKLIQFCVQERRTFRLDINIVLAKTLIRRVRRKFKFSFYCQKKIFQSCEEQGQHLVFFHSCFLDKDQTDEYIQFFDQLPEPKQQNLEKIYHLVEHQLTNQFCLSLSSTNSQKSMSVIQQFRKAGKELWLLSSESKQKSLCAAYNTTIFQRNIQNFCLQEINKEDIKVQMKGILQQFCHIQCNKLNEDHGSSVNNLLDSAKRVQPRLDQHRSVRINKTPSTQQIRKPINNNQFNIIIQGLTLECILSDAYLIHHFAFLLHFCVSLVGYNMNEYQKGQLIDFRMKQSLNECKILSIISSYNSLDMNSFSSQTIQVIPRFRIYVKQFQAAMTLNQAKFFQQLIQRLKERTLKNKGIIKRINNILLVSQINSQRLQQCNYQLQNLQSTLDAYFCFSLVLRQILQDLIQTTFGRTILFSTIIFIQYLYWDNQTQFFFYFRRDIMFIQITSFAFNAITLTLDRLHSHSLNQKNYSYNLIIQQYKFNEKQLRNNASITIQYLLFIAKNMLVGLILGLCLQRYMKQIFYFEQISVNSMMLSLTVYIILDIIDILIKIIHQAKVIAVLLYLAIYLIYIQSFTDYNFRQYSLVIFQPDNFMIIIGLILLQFVIYHVFQEFLYDNLNYIIMEKRIYDQIPSDFYIKSSITRKSIIQYQSRIGSSRS